jgi:prophage regulatory protein
MVFDMYYNLNFMKLKDVSEMTSLSKSSIYRLMADGDFPSQIPLGARSVVWVRSEIEEWCSKKIAAYR